MANQVEPFYFQLGQQIQNYRKLRGLTQERLGVKLNPQMTRASVANIEAGKQRVLSHTLFSIAETLNLNVLNLVVESEEVSAHTVFSEDLKSELTTKLGLSSNNAVVWGKKLLNTY